METTTMVRIDDLMLPGEVAAHAGFTADALRFHDHDKPGGLQPAGRTRSGVRLYLRSQVEAWLRQRKPRRRRPHPTE